jgi:CRP/FNR family transcriptional regulator, anaerobic regulatory protein
MQKQRAGEADCGECSSAQRCWRGEATPDAGFLVRRVRLLEVDEELFQQGSTFEAPYIVTSGCMALIELLPDGRERILAFRVPGEMVGLESWNCGVNEYSARAIAQTTLCRLRWNAGSLTRNATLLRTLLAKSTSAAGRMHTPWPGLSAQERVSRFIEDFRNRTDQPLPMTRAQIGSYLGMAEETVVRSMKALGLHGRTRALPD